MFESSIFSRRPFKIFNLLVVMSTLKSLGFAWFLERAHLEPMRGNFTDNKAYCSKQGALVQFGDPPVCNGGRSDRNEVYRLLKSGATHYEVMQHDFSQYARFMKTIDRYYAMHPPAPRAQPVEVVLFFGPPGCGKTELARSQFPDSYFLPIGKNLWFTMFASGAKHVVIDDFKANLALTDLLRLLDRYPLEVEVKGSHLWFYPETIIVTTNKSPHHWYIYNDRDYEKEALFRRFSSAFRFYKNDEKVPRPVEIDINNSFHFSEEYVAGVRQTKQVWSVMSKDFITVCADCCRLPSVCKCV